MVNNDLNKLEETFIQFLLGYTCEGHTTTDELNERLYELTRDFVLHTYTESYFTCNMLEWYLEELNENLNDDLKGFITLHLDKRRYENLLVKYLQHTLTDTSE